MKPKIYSINLSNMEIMVQKIKYIKILIILFFLFASSSCYTLKKRIKSDKISYNQIYDSIKTRRISYNNLEYKSLVKFSSSTEVHSFYSNVIIYKDSSLFLSAVLPFGINLAKILMTQDSIKFYSPIKNEFLKADSNFLLDNYNLALNYFSLQSILTANFFPYPYFYTPDKYEFYNDSLFQFTNIIHNKRNQKVIDATSKFSYNKEYLLENVFIEDNILKKKLYIKYSDYKKYNKNYFPSFIEIKIIANSDTMNLSFKNKNFKINTNSIIKFNIPSNAKIIN